jgi:hypothetical protein
MKNGLIESANGDKCWYLNGKRHREDGPAIEYANGSKFWYLNDKLHREDGPAIESANGNKFWFLNGKRLTISKWLDLNNHFSDQEKVMLTLLWA